MEMDAEADAHLLTTDAPLQPACSLPRPASMVWDCDSSQTCTSREAIWRPQGPTTLDDVLSWAPALLQQLRMHKVGDHLFRVLASNLCNGIQVHTDYSVMGGPEIAMSCIVEAVQQHVGPPLKVRFWRASDILLHARDVLSCTEGRPGPGHVFGDILHRAPRRTRTKLNFAVERVKREVMQHSGDALATAYEMEVVGKRFMANLLDVLKKEPFCINRRNYCFKHKAMCRVHGPEQALDDVVLRLAVAGSTCTSWTRMGGRSHWPVASAVPFAVWATETLFWEPDLVVHECTPDFDIQFMEELFIARYLVQSIVFSPIMLGIPTNRPRRYTLMIHRGRLLAAHAFTLPTFSSLFSRTLRTSGHIFWSAPDNVVEAMVQQMARRLALPDTQVTGEPWPCRQVLPEGDLQRHLQYEWGCRKKRKEPRFIVNLRQNHAFMQSFSEVVPALLTKTSLLWSMQVERMLAPLGHLLVIGRACPQG